ncbi:MAG: hypothetical protein J1F17_07185 [Oscillospiraceae bacterium]|nr:hypothetical protein [Oscillospiraceae bacterium]
MSIKADRSTIKINAPDLVTYSFIFRTMSCFLIITLKTFADRRNECSPIAEITAEKMKNPGTIPKIKNPNPFIPKVKQSCVSVSPAPNPLKDIITGIRAFPQGQKPKRKIEIKNRNEGEKKLLNSRRKSKLLRELKSVINKKSKAFLKSESVFVPAYIPNIIPTSMAKRKVVKKP